MRDAVVAARPVADALDATSSQQRPVRKFYTYLDAASRDALADPVACSHPEWMDIEDGLRAALIASRRDSSVFDLSCVRDDLERLSDRIDELKPEQREPLHCLLSYVDAKNRAALELAMWRDWSLPSRALRTDPLTAYRLRIGVMSGYVTGSGRQGHGLCDHGESRQYTDRLQPAEGLDRVDLHDDPADEQGAADHGDGRRSRVAARRDHGRERHGDPHHQCERQGGDCGTVEGESLLHGRAEIDCPGGQSSGSGERPDRDDTGQERQYGLPDIDPALVPGDHHETTIARLPWLG
ncbi:hypothetical protein [Nocardia sp. BMG51109]|uniref:hypothetical protein n=1 Tax=Nocardia sp. BMG51109 TaxID=1056816 RepID=UPI0018DD7D8B|nr:hypothetical protein [Nocardia sp. BMG51109]